MQMTICWRYSDGKFSSAQSPIDTSICSFDSAISKAGYFPQLQMNVDAAATIYQHVDGANDEPHFLIDLWGAESQMALLVVDDFNHLIETLATIAPLSNSLAFNRP